MNTQEMIDCCKACIEACKACIDECQRCIDMAGGEAESPSEDMQEGSEMGEGDKPAESKPDFVIALGRRMAGKK